MLVLLAVVIVLAGTFGLGWLILAALTSQYETPVGTIVEVGLLSLALGILALGWVALLLAEVGCFSLLNLGVIWLAGVLTLAVVLRNRGASVKIACEMVGGLELAALGIWLVVACYLFFRPHQCIVGGADAGVYVNLGSRIARSGSILIHDQTLAELDPTLYPVLLREYPDASPVPYYLFPGFYVPGEPSGLVIPQFYALHPVWLAVFHSLGGVEASLLGAPLWAILGSLAVYLAARQMFGWKTALLSLGTLTITAMQVWFARYPTTEMLTQYLCWIGVYAFSAWISNRQPARLWALVAGLSLGEVLLARIDMYFLLIIPVLLGLWLRWSGDRPGRFRWFIVPFLGLAVHSLVHGRVLSWPYFDDLYQSGLWLLRKYLMIPALLAVVGMLGLVVLDKKQEWRDKISQRWVSWRPFLLAGLITVVVGLAVYGYWIRPRLGGSTTMQAYWYGGGDIPTNLDRENLVRLGWYLSPLGLALAVVGICLSLWNLKRETALFMGAGLFFSLLYLWRILANPHQIYAMRRYVPIVLPFFIVAAAYSLAWLYERSRRWQRWGGVALGVVWIAHVAWLARGFVSQVDYQGILAQMETLNAQLAPGSVLIFDDQSAVGQGDFLGTSLHFLYGHDVFSLRRPELLIEGQLEQQIARWQSERREVYWLEPQQDMHGLENLVLEYLGDYQTSLVVLEAPYESRPWRRITIDWAGEISRVVDLGGEP